MNTGDEFVYEVMGKIINIFNKVTALEYENEGQFHMIFKAQILFLSKEFNLEGKKDFKNEICISEKDSKIQYIDVIWDGEYRTIAAFEITSDFKTKPVAKLNRIDAVYKFWIYYGNTEIPQSKTIINDYDIHIVKLVK